jgi:hypothetical protein
LDVLTRYLPIRQKHLPFLSELAFLFYVRYKSTCIGFNSWLVVKLKAPINPYEQINNPPTRLPRSILYPIVYLVVSSSSKALNDASTESHDKGIIELNSGHVGLMIEKDAHKELWPKVGEWLKKRPLTLQYLGPCES